MQKLLKTLVALAALGTASAAAPGALQPNTKTHGKAASTQKLAEPVGSESQKALGLDSAINIKQSNLFCVEGEPSRWEQSGVHPSAMNKRTWCPHNDGVCCSASSFCCPGGYTCSTDEKPKCLRPKKVAVEEKEEKKEEKKAPKPTSHYTNVDNTNRLEHNVGGAAAAAAASSSESGSASASAPASESGSEESVPSGSDSASASASAPASSGSGEVPSGEAAESSGEAAESSEPDESSEPASGADSDSSSFADSSGMPDVPDSSSSSGDDVSKAMAYAIRKAADGKGSHHVILANHNSITQTGGAAAADDSSESSS